MEKVETPKVGFFRWRIISSTFWISTFSIRGVRSGGGKIGQSPGTERPPRKPISAPKRIILKMPVEKPYVRILPIGQPTIPAD